MGHSRSIFAVALGVAVALAATAATTDAQRTAAGTDSTIGDVAPAFIGRGATRYGRVADPIRVSDYHGKTIVLAYFFQARTPG